MKTRRQPVHLFLQTETLSAKQVGMMGMNSKKKRVEDQYVGSDRLCHLPLSIIHIILARIPIRDAVRTSVLSTQWRYTWTTLPQLVFDDKCANKKDKSKPQYNDIISRVLFLHKGPILRFKLACSVHFPNAHQWLTCLSRNGIQELILERMAYNFEIEMQSSLYCCEKLTYLRTFCCTWEPPPVTFKGFLFLRSLSVTYFSRASDDITRIVSSCPLIESFELNELTKTPELKISAPNLKYMRLTGKHKKIFINAPHLTEIAVYLFIYDMEARDQELKSSACEYLSCFAGFTNLQHLTMSSYFTKYLSFGIKLYHHSLVFHHLKLINVSLEFKYLKEVMVLARLVSGAPSLQELIIGSLNRKDNSNLEAPYVSLVDSGFAPNFKLENLTDVSLLDFNAFPLEAEFLKILLERSPVLETVWVGTEKNRIKVKDISQWCYWASPPIVKPCYWEKKSPDRFRRPF